MHKIASCLTSLLLYFCGTFVCKADSDLFTSAIVVNSKNGEILYSYNADKKIYPASLTKMMTAYIVFEKISQGAIGLYDNIDVKNYRLSNLTSLFPRQNQITIRDLLIKIIVNSKNTPAEVLALEIYGNTKSFVNEMNKKAKQFGMSGTHFANTHGLFNENHYSTARDMANIVIRLTSDFPEYAELFNITEYIDNQDDIETKTSTIQKNIKGVKGSKTGYISASGYNIAIWGSYGNQQNQKDNIVAVLIGAKSKKQRDDLALKLLNATIKNEFNTQNNITNNQNTTLEEIMYFFGIKPENYTSNTPQQRAKYRFQPIIDEQDNEEIENVLDLPDEKQVAEEEDLSSKISVQNNKRIFEDTQRGQYSKNNQQKFELSVKNNNKKKNRFYMAR